MGGGYRADLPTGGWTYFAPSAWKDCAWAIGRAGSVFCVCAWCSGTDTVDEAADGRGTACGGDQRERIAAGGIPSYVLSQAARIVVRGTEVAVVCARDYLGGGHCCVFCGPRHRKASSRAALESQENLGRHGCQLCGIVARWCGVYALAECAPRPLDSDGRGGEHCRADW